MAFDLDGLAVLAGMAAKPDAFAGIEADAAKIARTLLAKLLKDRATALPAMQAMASALPNGTLAHVTDGMTDAEIATLAARLDPFNTAVKAADRHGKAGLIDDLVSGAARPAPPAVKGKKATLPKSPAKKPPSSGVEAAKKVLGSKAMGAKKSAKAAGV